MINKNSPQTSFLGCLCKLLLRNSCGKLRSPRTADTGLSNERVIMLIVLEEFPELCQTHTPLKSIRIDEDELVRTTPSEIATPRSIDDCGRPTRTSVVNDCFYRNSHATSPNLLKPLLLYINNTKSQIQKLLFLSILFIYQI
jgi:hypothetical protein